MSAGITSEAVFEQLGEALLSELASGEHLTLDWKAEDSLFVRFTQGKVRQPGHVRAGELGLLLVLEGQGGELREGRASLSVMGDAPLDLERARAELAKLRAEVRDLPPSPWARLPQLGSSSQGGTRGQLLEPGQAAEALLRPAAGLDLAGLLASGTVVRGTLSSAGLRHWFSTDTFCLDHSAYAPGGGAHKATYAGTHWDPAAWERHLEQARTHVEILERPVRKVPPGDHRAWLGPAAVGELVQMLSWGCMGEGALRQGDSPLRHVRSGARTFSPKFTLAEDFRSGDCPRFTPEGDLSPQRVSLIEGGQLVSTLISARTAREHGLESNGAEAEEALRSPSIASGSVDEAELFSALGTGLYLPNLWYLNWSDQPGGRVTGMTRYACLWVEEGRPVGPIEALRFDDSIFRIFGSELEALGRQVHVVPDVHTYDQRSLGALRTPGLLLSALSFTL